MADDVVLIACTATKKCTENDSKNVTVSKHKGVFQRPPSGKQARTNTPVNNSANNNNNTTINNAANTTHLLFEPAPPSQTRKYHSRNAPRYRRIQSAHGRIGAPSLPQNKAHTIVKNRGVQSRTRPKSAVVPGENVCYSGLDSARLSPASAVVTPIPKQFLTLDLSDSDDPARRRSRSSHQNGDCTNRSERPSLRRSPGKAANAGRSIPKGIAQLSPWLSEDVPIELCGVDPKSCLMFLPCVSDMEEWPSELGPVQHTDECVIPYTVLPSAPKPFDPKKLFHYDVERHIQEAEAFYDRRNIYSVDGRLLHDEKRYSRHRSSDIIAQEIEDLERLLAGIGNSDGNSIVVQYQEEINKLQRDVRKTLARCPKYEEEIEEEPPDVTGLRTFIKEREEVIAKIKARREACLAELDSLSLEADVGMTMQKEVLEAFKNL